MAQLVKKPRRDVLCRRPHRQSPSDFPKAPAVGGLECRLPPDFRCLKAFSTVPTWAGVDVMRHPWATILCVCVCVCVRERERHRERDRQRDRQTERQRDREREKVSCYPSGLCRKTSPGILGGGFPAQVTPWHVWKRWVEIGPICLCLGSSLGRKAGFD